MAERQIMIYQDLKLKNGEVIVTDLAKEDIAKLEVVNFAPGPSLPPRHGM